MHKTKELLATLELAKSIDKTDPLGTSFVYTSEGMIEANKQGRLHPWVGLMLYASAYGNEDLTRALSKACLAMEDMKKIYERLPRVKEWEKMLKDPANSEQGYFIPAIGGTLWGGNLESRRNMIKAGLEYLKNKKKKKIKFIPYATTDAYLLPNGELINVGYQGHIHYADKCGYKTDEPEKLGWIKISAGAVWLNQKTPTKKQLDKLEGWCRYHKKDFDSILRVVSGKDWNRVLFDRTWSTPKKVDGD